MKIVDKRPNMKAVYFSNISAGDVFRYYDYVYMSVYDHGSGETFGVDLTTGQVVYFNSGDFVYPIKVELCVMS